MDGARASRYPYLSWLNARISLRADTGRTAMHLRSVAHCVSMTVTGRHSVRWIRRGREQGWGENPGTIHFRPCTWDSQDFIIDSAESGDVLACFIPAKHLDELLESEGMEAGREPERFLLPHDAVLQRSLSILSACRATTDDTDGRQDETARRMVLRLVELSCGKTADWRDDDSVFDRRTLLSLVEHIDGNLRHAPALGDMSLRTGLSPSHFAKKFRQSTGLSLHRFINRRRLLRSLDMLMRRSQSLADIAADIGFSSQSHFTRLFSKLTGMTPAKYRKQFAGAVD